MRKEDWQTTSSTTNAAESAHAKSKRAGTRLSLLAVISKGRRLDCEFLDSQKARINFGIASRYGNMSYSTRKKRAIRREQGRMTKSAQNRHIRSSQQDPMIEDEEEVEGGDNSE